MSNPYLIHGPAIISVSGGRTSGFMLRQIMDAHGGKLPVDVVPVFSNTGLEHEATLQFLKEIGERWTPIVWLEYTGRNAFKTVTFCTASRRGEPFAALITAEKCLPNVMARFCTKQLKILTVERYVRSLGWTDWTNAVGIRADEHRRVSNMRDRDGVLLPMASAGDTRADVMAFWSTQPFDLQLPGDDPAFGNCVGCFLKGRAKLNKAMRSMPDHFDWWARQEEKIGHRFDKRRPTYRQMLTQLTVQGQLYDDAIEDDTLPCQCTD